MQWLMRLPHFFLLSLIPCLFAISVYAEPLAGTPVEEPVTGLNPVIAYWTKLANDGDKFSQSKLASKYERGDGVLQDYKQAAYWYQKAADQGLPKAQQTLGKFYEEGVGVAQDFEQALYWYREAAFNDYYLGLARLARMYELGRGVNRDLNIAVKLYQKSTDLEPSGPAWIGDAVARLNAKKQCALSAQTTLFSEEVLCVSREDLLQAIDRAGGVLTQARDSGWYDRYNSVNLLSNSSELIVGYTRAGEFALAQYTFPSESDPHQVSEIKAMVQNRYGLPTSVGGSPRHGKVNYAWKTKDGIEIRVSRGWPNTTTYMVFRNPKVYSEMLAEINAYKNTQK